METLTDLKPPGKVCEACNKTGSTWVHLRTCQSCGITLCCDSSPHQHMTAHSKTTGHHLIVSAEPGERWMFCYEHDLFATY